MLVFFFGLFLISFVICDANEFSKPNILLIVTDDQDEVLHGMLPMRNVQRLLEMEGATFSNAFTSSPLCCPSRASILSGMYAHNHRTTNNSASGGCYGTHWKSRVEPNALPTVLQAHGYETFFAGKYLNEYFGVKVPPGWSEFYGLHGNSRYYNYTLTENGNAIFYSDTYLTDLLKEKTLKFLDTRQKKRGGKPFFAMIAPPACHAPFTPAARHDGVFTGIKALRTPNFNQLSQILDKHWLVQSSRSIPSSMLATLDEIYQQRWETLLAVDEMVASFVKSLESSGDLQNTYIVYTSDNGYHIGQFAQPYDKRQPYETDIRVPFIVRGPNVPQQAMVKAPISLVDLFPTILEWAAINPLGTEDGQSFHAYLMNSLVYNPLTDKNFNRALLVQHWGEGNDDTYNGECPYRRKDHLSGCTLSSDCHCQDAWNNTYSCIRHFRYNTNKLYCEFKDAEHFVEAYDLDTDPYEMTNLGYELLPIERAFYSLALANLTRCAGSSCRNVNI